MVAGNTSRKGIILKKALSLLVFHRFAGWDLIRTGKDVGDLRVEQDASLVVPSGADTRSANGAESLAINSDVFEQAWSSEHAW